MTKDQLEESMMNSYDSIVKAVGPQKLRSILLGAKASLLGKSSLPKAARLQQLLMHRSVEKKIFGLLDTDAAIHIDELVEKAELNSSEVLAALCEMEMKGMVRQMPGKQFIKILL